jgi:hypothetical protein
MLPGLSHQSFVPTSPKAPLSSIALLITPLVVPGLQDVAVKEYSVWQQLKVSDQMLKAEFQKVCNVALANGLDLEQIYKDQDPSFFTDKGVIIDVA